MEKRGNKDLVWWKLKNPGWGAATVPKHLVNERLGKTDPIKEMFINEEMAKTRADSGNPTSVCADMKSPLPPLHPLVKEMQDRKGLEPLSKEWFEARATRITASDAAVIVHKDKHLRGKNPYVSRDALIRKKCQNVVSGLTERQKNPPVFSYCRQAQQWGVKYEPAALALYETLTGNTLLDPHPGFMYGGPKTYQGKWYPVPDWLGATPDGVVRDKPIVVEVKCPMGKARGTIHEEEPDDVPDAHWTQLQIQMAVTGAGTAHYARYRPPDHQYHGFMRIVEVKFDIDWYRGFLLLAMEFRNELQMYWSKQKEVPARAVRNKRLKKEVPSLPKGPALV